MNRKVVASCGFIWLLLVFFSSFGSVRAAPSEPNAVSDIPPGSLAPWYIQYVDQQDSVGRYPSIALHPVTEKPYISYYDSTNGDLRLAKAVPPGSGNCGQDGNGFCQTIDGDVAHGDTNVGMFSSIDLWGTEAHWKIGISYYDSTNGALKFAQWDSNTNSWNIVTINDPILTGFSAGRYSSFKYGSDGSMHIAYYYSSALGSDSLRYAHNVLNGGNCGIGSAAGKWQCDLIDSGDFMGSNSSLDLNSNNQPRISYYNGDQLDLKFAYYVGTGGYGCAATGWRCITVDFGDNVGSFTSLSVSSNPEKWHIAYYNNTSGKLRYSMYLGQSGNGNCGFSSISLHFEWQCDDIDSMGAGLLQAGIGLGVDAAGYPIIAYMDAAQNLAPATLNIARPALATSTISVGNCGPANPAPPNFLTWQCNVLDNALYGQGYVELAQYLDLTTNSAGSAFIAYYEYDSYYDDEDLKLAYQQFKLFLPLIMNE